MIKKWTGERLETHIYGEFVSEHLHRYCIANNFVKGKIVLDIASGEGYGTNLLSKNAKKVYGVDIDKKSIENAKQKYKNKNLIFQVGSADKIPLESKSVDVIVSFETIEHHDKHFEMFEEIKRILKDDGILIMSSPEKKFHSDIPNKINPFHIKELYLEEFKDLFKNNFTFFDVYFQRYINKASFIASVIEFQNLTIFSGDFEAIQTRNLNPLYNIIIASNARLSTVNMSIFDGELLSHRMNQDLINNIHSSTTFIVGSIFTYPFFVIKKYLKRNFK